MNSFYYFEICFINTLFTESFLALRVFNFIESLFCTCWDSHVVFVIGSVYLMDYAYWFAYVEPALPTKDEAELIVVDKLLMCYWIQFSLRILFYWRFLCLCSSWILAWSFLFLLSLCQVLVSGWYWSHKIIWEGFPLFGLFGIVSEEMVPAPLCVGCKAGSTYASL